MSQTRPSSPQAVELIDSKTISGVVAPKLLPETKLDRGLYFWLTFLAICVSLFMSALEVVGISLSDCVLGITCEGVFDRQERLQHYLPS